MVLGNVFICGEKSTWTDRKHWRELVDEELSITDSKGASDNDAKLSPPSSAIGKQLQKRLLEDGYVLVDKILEKSLTLKLKNAITALHERAYPATFVLLFDETWQLARLALETLNEVTHPRNVFNFDMLAWYIDPCENAAGFSPHRDRQPDNVKSSFHDDGQAKYVTMWMALSNATPKNSCLYVIPKQNDPGYTNGDSDANGDDKNENPLWRALPTKESFQNVRALPRQAGQSLLFTHRILHWGSRGNPNALENEPRVAISFVCSDPSFENPYLKSSQFPPPFDARLLLVCAQLLIYYQRFNLSKDCIRSCYEYVKEHSDELDDAYRNKITVEFVKAMNEADESNSDGVACKVTGEQDGDGDSDEAVLDAMLDAEEGGYGEFRDDFDEMDDEAVASGEEEGGHVQDASSTGFYHSDGKRRRVDER